MNIEDKLHKKSDTTPVDARVTSTKVRENNLCRLCSLA